MSTHAPRNAKPTNFPVMMFTGIASSMLVIAVYKFVFKPQMLRNRREEADQCARFLLNEDKQGGSASEFVKE